MSNPYQSPGELPQIKTQGSHASGSPMQPLVHATMWLQIIAWFNIVFGALYCLTIVGIVIAWLPIWIGILLKNAADKLKAGEAHHRGAAKDLASVATIVGVLTVINIIVLCLYILFFLLMVVISVAGAAAAGAAAN